MSTEALPDLHGKAPEASPTSGFDGSGIFSDFANTVKDASNFDGLGVAMDGAATAMDALAFAEDPLGALLSAGVGWLIEHLDFLRKPLDLLAGDPTAIAAQANTWTNVGAEMKKVGEDYEKAISTDIAAWKSEAGTAYREKGKDLAEALKSFSDAADGAATGVTIGGVLVGTERGIIRDLISTFVGKMIERALIALASSWCTFGASVAAFIVDAVAEGSILAGKCASRIAKVLEKLAQLAGKFGKLGQALEKMALKLKGFAKDAGHFAGKLKGDQAGSAAKVQDFAANHLIDSELSGKSAKDIAKDALKEQFTTHEVGGHQVPPLGGVEAGRQSHEAVEHTEEGHEQAEEKVEGKEQYASHSGTLE